MFRALEVVGRAAAFLSGVIGNRSAISTVLQSDKELTAKMLSSLYPDEVLSCGWTDYGTDCCSGLPHHPMH